MLKHVKLLDSTRCNDTYHWNIPLKQKLNICKAKLNKANFNIYTRESNVYVYSKDFDCWYSDSGDNSLSDLLNNIDI